MNLFSELLQSAKDKPPFTVAIVAPEDSDITEMIKEACKLKIANFLLFGNENKIKVLLSVIPKGVTIINTLDENEACYLAVNAVSKNEADVLMKGLVPTAKLISHVLNKEYGLRTNRLLSHIMICELSRLERFILLSDGGLNIDPDVQGLSDITLNAIHFARLLNITRPNVALLSAIEYVNPKIPSTVKCRSAVENLIAINPNTHIEGPLALDIALSLEAAAIKGYTGHIAGNADILIVPFMEMANVLYKGWMFGCNNNKAAGLIVGAKAPIILNSRADTKMTKLYSLALAGLTRGDNYE